MHILIAPNAFKNSLSATEAARAIKEGFLASKLKCTCACFPVGDGGDGTGELLGQALGAKTTSLPVHDPLGRMIEASFGFIDAEKTAIIEMAAASGLRLLKPDELDPLRATSFGTGEQIIQALNKGAQKVIICAGGSATVDAGMGILIALGAVFLDEQQRKINSPAELYRLHAVEMANLDSRIPDTDIVVLCDVDNPLLGDDGAVAVFAPQKGANEYALSRLQDGLRRFVEIYLNETGIDIGMLERGGCAGGVGAGLYAYAKAKLVKGIDYFLKYTGFEAELAKAELVVTGEGSLDEQTLKGKAPFGVALRAYQNGIKTAGLAGILPQSPSAAIKKFFPILRTINPNALPLETSIRQTGHLLYEAALQLGNELDSNRLRHIL